MEQLNKFIVNNYIWIVIGCLFLIFTLIGYMADKSKSKDNDSKKSKTINPSPIVNNEEIKEIVNNEVVTNEEKVSEPIESTNIIESMSNEVQNETIEENNNDVPKQKSLEELMAENNISSASIDLDVSNSEVDETKVEEDKNEKEIEQNEDQKESVNEEINENVEVTSSWEPELTVENKDIAPEKEDEKKDSI